MSDLTNDNVIILGAGASFDAKIPLLNNFIDTMWEFSVRGKNGKASLSDDDKKIFANAIKVRDELDGYHGRANFDDRNLEDILSILSFNLMGGTKSDRERLKWMINAISRTIELKCELKHTGENRIINSGDRIYRSFWEYLFNLFKDINTLPTIISFNYDLVLERALLQLLNNTIYNLYSNEFPKQDGLSIDYKNRLLPVFNIKIENAMYQVGDNFEEKRGTKTKLANEIELRDQFRINLLKLHGSLNFSSTNTQNVNIKSLVEINKEPLILPPIFNKLNSKKIEETWKFALHSLRNCKNVIVVGYSLPKTDIYMNYFLKTALGPNVNLNKIIIFNPILFENSNENDLMRERYADCFAPQLQRRIIFEPRRHRTDTGEGTFRHFVSSIKMDNELFF